MAFSVRLIGYPDNQSSPNLDWEIPWWPSDELRRDPRMIISNDSGSYQDYDADLTVDEVRRIHERYRASASTGIYGCDAWQQRIRPMLEELDTALKEDKIKPRRFHVRVFEWDSGLG